MWLLIPIAFAFLVGVALSLLGGGIFTIVAVPLVLLGVAGFAAWFMVKGRDPNAPQVVSPPREPTGVPRAASGGAKTTNRRVGQD
jgi:hypothetical protein